MNIPSQAGGFPLPRPEIETSGLPDVGSMAAAIDGWLATRITSEHGLDAQLDLLKRIAREQDAAIAAKDARIAELTEALNRLGAHQLGCRRLFEGMAHTQRSDCDCGLFTALGQPVEVKQ